MDAVALIQNQVEESGYQLSKVLEGLAGEQWDAKLNDESMSPREAVAHLADCYAACQTPEGQEYAWGSFAVPSDADEAVATMMAERQKAAAHVLAQPAERAGKLATAYIVLHDAYHVGQVAALRLQLGGWDAYSIYRM